MQYVSLILNIIFLVFLVIGFLMGLKRGSKRTVVRTIWLAVIVVLLLLVSSKITTSLLNVRFQSESGTSDSIKDYIVTILKDMVSVEGADYESVANVVMILVGLVLNAVVFLVLYLVLKVVSLGFYWFGNAFIFTGERRKKRRAKKEKQKIKIKKHRLVGGLIGIIVAFVGFCVVLTPVAGYVAIAKDVEKQTANGDGVGVLTEQVGDTYGELINQYDSSVPIKIISTLKIDKLMMVAFDGLTSSKVDGRKIVLSDEATTLAKVYAKVEEIGSPDLNTISQSEFDTVLKQANELVDLMFESNIVSVSSDVIVPFAVKFARQNVDTTNYKPYVLAFYNAVYDELEKFDSTSTKEEVKNVIAIVKTLNDYDILLPIIQNQDQVNVDFIKDRLTKQASNDIISSLFGVKTVNNLAPALVNFLLGAGAEELGYDYSNESQVTADSLKQSAITIMESVISLAETYDDSTSTKIAINETTVEAFGKMLDEIKNILSESNFTSVVNAIEPKIQNVVDEMVDGQPDFIKNTATEVIGNISDISNYKNTFVKIYKAYDVFKTELDNAKVENEYNVELMDFVKLGGAMDDFQNSGLFKNDLLLRAMKDAVEYYAGSFEDQITTDDKPFEFTFDEQLISNISGLIDNGGIVWKDELPKYKNTVGVMANLFQGGGDVLEKVKSDYDTSLQDLGKELDGDLKDSALFKGTSRLLVGDLLNIADIKINTDDNKDLSKFLQDSRANVLNESLDINWENEFTHIKQLVKLQFGSTEDESLLEIASAIDSITSDTTVNGVVVPASKIFTKPIVNNYIASYMDDVFPVDAGSDFYDTIESIKTSFKNNNISTYYTEIQSLLALKDMKEIVDDPDFKFNEGVPAGAVKIGQKIDTALGYNGRVVTKSLVNDFIVKKLDTYFEKYSSDLSKEITAIKNGFNDNIVKYEAEFTALVNLMEVSDIASSDTFSFESKIDATRLGQSIDTTLAKVTIGGTDYSSTIVTKSLINGYIKRFVGDSSNVSISNAQFGNVITNITGTKTGDEYGEGRLDNMSEFYGSADNVYEKEFGYLAQLLVVSKAYSNITIDTINKEVKLQTSDSLNTTLADQYDGYNGTVRLEVSDPIRNSYLVGDSLLEAIETVLEDYATKNTDYTNILAEVNSNYSTTNGVKANVRWIDNNDGSLSYGDVINAFVEINASLNSNLTADITKPSDLLKKVNIDGKEMTLAEYYDAKLFELQGFVYETNAIDGNILLGTNGVNELTKFVMGKVKTVLNENATTFASEIAFIDSYVSFLNGSVAVGTSDTTLVKNTYVPYGTITGATIPTMYAYEYTTGIWVYEVGATTQNGIKINTPFETIADMINTKASE